MSKRRWMVSSGYGREKTDGLHLRPVLMSALPPKADIDRARWDVRFVPKADIMQCSNRSHLLGHALLNFRQ
jgi:hypothetical protein